MSTPVDQLFNLVVLPKSDPETEPRLWQLSATRMDRSLRLVSPVWAEPELQAAMRLVGVSNVQFENLLRGNRMAEGGRDTRRIFFTEEQLRAAGLSAWQPREASTTVPLQV